MKIYTKKGDSGTTQLLGGMRVSKNHERIEAYGSVDELNSWIGYVADHTADQQTRSVLQDIQHHLFNIGSSLAVSGEIRMPLPPIREDDAAKLEAEIDRMEASLPELKSFILPGGHPSNSICHISRCVCRRAERKVVALSGKDNVDPAILIYLNRLSDYLFVLARKFSHDNKAAEVVWQPREKK
jgi:cob(I)alamin adenosyltransferase